MIRLALETAAAVSALWGMAFLILGARAKRKDGTSRQWINYLADESRKRKAPGMRKRCRYSRAR